MRSEKTYLHTRIALTSVVDYCSPRNIRNTHSVTTQVYHPRECGVAQIEPSNSGPIFGTLKASCKGQLKHIMSNISDSTIFLSHANKTKTTAVRPDMRDIDRDSHVRSACQLPMGIPLCKAQQ